MRTIDPRFTFSLLAALLLLIFAGCGGTDDERGAKLIVDDAAVLTDISEALTVHLENIRDQYGIEIVLATVYAPEADETLRELTARRFTDWNIGREYDGRGLLMLLADRPKSVRIEVGSVLEHVYTDLFTGHIENKQLPAYYTAGQLEIGLIALVEEIELRAQLMSKDEADAATIGALDQKFLSGGGGADVALSRYNEVRPVETSGTYPAGSTPEEAWQTLIRSWREKNRNPDIGVYTPVTRLIYRAFTNLPDSRFEEDVRTWGDKPYEIISSEDYAVVFFGRKKGWDNAPFLFCRTAEGWQFDMVHQRKIVRMGRAPAWGIERGEHPYIELLSRAPYWMGQDIPLSVEERYDVSKDADTAAMILHYENQLAQNPDDFETLLNLGILYSRTSMGQKRISLLKKAGESHPDHPDVLKHLAVAHVDAHYQYRTALEIMDRYIRVRADDPFGHFFHGYLLLMLDEPEKAVRSLEKGLEMDSTNIYGLCKLARAHLAIGGDVHAARAESVLKRVTEIDSDHIRVEWLKRSLEKQRD